MNAGSALDFSSETVILASTFRDFISGGIIRTGAFAAEFVDTFLPTGGTVEIQPDDGSFAGITCSNGNYFHNLTINPTADGGGVLESNVIVQNDLEVSAGALRFDGFEATVLNNVLIFGELIMDNPLDVLNAGDELGDAITWKMGSSSDNLSNGTINVYGNWIFEDGTEVNLDSGSVVNFVGSWNQFITCQDSDAAFGNVNFNQTAMSSWLHSACTQPMRVNGDMTILNRDFRVQNNDLIITGILDIQDGTSLDIGDSGSVINNSNLNLLGTLDVGEGEVLIYGEFQLENTGILTIDGGNFISDAPYSGTWQIFNGTLNFSDGLLEITHNLVQIGVNFEGNITGGVFRVGSSFKLHEWKLCS